MEARDVTAIARKEIRDAARNGWLVFYGAAASRSRRSIQNGRDAVAARRERRQKRTG
jgi:hypothetical protein